MLALILTWAKILHSIHIQSLDEAAWGEKAKRGGGGSRLYSEQLDRVDLVRGYIMLPVAGWQDTRHRRVYGDSFGSG